MHRIFNMGIGMVLIASPHVARALQEAFEEETWIIGEVVPGDPEVRLA
jgi:phosphoribosylaminoimidazole (AIR) synthetase